LRLDEGKHRRRAEGWWQRAAGMPERSQRLEGSRVEGAHVRDQDGLVELAAPGEQRGNRGDAEAAPLIVSQRAKATTANARATRRPAGMRCDSFDARRRDQDDERSGCQHEAGLHRRITEEAYALAARSVVHGLASLLIEGQLGRRPYANKSPRELANRALDALRGGFQSRA